MDQPREKIMNVSQSIHAGRIAEKRNSSGESPDTIIRVIPSPFAYDEDRCDEVTLSAALSEKSAECYTLREIVDAPHYKSLREHERNHPQ